MVACTLRTRDAEVIPLGQWLYKQLYNNLFLSSVVLVAVQYDKFVSGLDILDNHIPTKL